MGQLIDVQVDFVFGLAAIGIVGVIFFVALVSMLAADIVKQGWRWDDE